MRFSDMIGETFIASAQHAYQQKKRKVASMKERRMP